MAQPKCVSLWRRLRVIPCLRAASIGPATNRTQPTPGALVAGSPELSRLGGLLAGGELQAVKLLGRTLAHPTGKALDAVVGAGEPVLIDQVLVDGHEVAFEPQLRFDEGAVRFVGRDRWLRASRWSGWGWGNLKLRAGGHPGGICLLSGKAQLIRADRLAIDPGCALNLALTPARLQQRRYRRL